MVHQANALGFLPITNLKQVNRSLSLRPKVIIIDYFFDPREIHKEVRNTKFYNFEEARILLPSKINFAMFEKIAHDYWDWKLPYFVKYGFPLDFPSHNEHKLSSTGDSHTSAMKYPDHVKKYLEKEIGHRASIVPLMVKAVTLSHSCLGLSLIVATEEL